MIIIATVVDQPTLSVLRHNHANQRTAFLIEFFTQPDPKHMKEHSCCQGALASKLNVYCRKNDQGNELCRVYEASILLIIVLRIMLSTYSPPRMRGRSRCAGRQSQIRQRQTCSSSTRVIPLDPNTCSRTSYVYSIDKMRQRMCITRAHNSVFEQACCMMRSMRYLRVGGDRKNFDSANGKDASPTTHSTHVCIQRLGTSKDNHRRGPSYKVAPRAKISPAVKQFPCAQGVTARIVQLEWLTPYVRYFDMSLEVILSATRQ